MERLFVYGTLAPGRANHGVMQTIPGSWTEATLRGRLLDEGWGADMGCPGIVPDEDGMAVDGFVFASEHLAEHWQMLDEGEGEGYRRVRVRVLLEGGEQVDAQVYALRHGA